MRGLKIVLWIAAVLCLLSVFGLFLPMSAWQKMTEFFGVGSLPDSPLLLYIARLLSATYAGVGVFFVILALNPEKYGTLVLFSAIASIALGIACALTGLAVKMPNLWFLSDALSAIILGILILVFYHRAQHMR